MEDVKDYWDDKWANRFEDRGNVPSETVKKVHEHIKDKKVLKVLDLGCGAGRDSYYLFNQGYKVTALDISKEALKFLQQKTHDIEFICMDIKDFAFPKNKYDMVFANLSLHYFDRETTQRIIEDIKNSIKDNGYFFIRCKSTKDPQFGDGEKIAHNTFKKDHIRHFFDEEYLRELLKDFNIIYLEESEDFYYSPSAFIEALAIKKAE